MKQVAAATCLFQGTGNWTQRANSELQTGGPNSDSEVQTGNWRQQTGNTELDREDWDRQGTWEQERDGELGTGNWEQGTGTSLPHFILEAPAVAENNWCNARKQPAKLVGSRLHEEDEQRALSPG